jgi:hypothetical protein
MNTGIELNLFSNTPTDPTTITLNYSTPNPSSAAVITISNGTLNGNLINFAYNASVVDAFISLSGNNKVVMQSVSLVVFLLKFDYMLLIFFVYFI